MGKLQRQLLTRHRGPRLRPLPMLLAALFVAPAAAQVPTGGQVVAGSASIVNVDAQHQVVTQGSDKAIINWQGYSLGVGSSVRYEQPSSSSVILNRVTGNDPSAILGSISANGQVFLVNPNGIYFGAGARLDVGGLVASSLNISNQDFLAGRYLFARDGNAPARAEVINAGVLKARDGGYVVLAGDYAANRGVVEARLGTVMLGSANKLTLDIVGDSLVSYALNERGVVDLAGVANSGQLLADGGRVVMTAATARNLASTAVNNSGVIQARGVAEKNGAVYLLADGGNINLESTSRIDASGDKGGGTVLIGGNFHGGGSEAHADTVTIAAGSTINADANMAGQGGQVAVWSDGDTRFAGAISARGGSQGGDGGFVEVSGKNLAFAGSVNTSAAKGKTGTLLLDPTTLTITDGAAVAGDLSGSGATINAGDANGSSSNGIAETTLEGLGATTNVVLEATGQITVANLTDNLLNMQQTSGNSLTLRSTTSGGITFADVNDEIRTQGGSILFQAQGSGSLSNIGKLTSNGGDITLQAANGITLKNNVAAGTGTVNLAATAGGVSQSAGTISADKLALTGAGTFSLGNANSVATLAANVTGSLSFKNATALAIGTVGATSGITTHSNSLKLDTGGGVTQTGDISASSLELISTSGATLTNSGNSVATFAAATNGATSFRTSGALTVGTAGGTSGVVSNGGDIALQSGGAMTLSQNVTAGAGGVTLTAGGGASQSGGAITGASLAVAGSGTFTLSSSSNDVTNLYGNLSGALNYRDANALNIGKADGSAGLNLNGNTLTLTTGGAITQTAALSVNYFELDSLGSGSTVNLSNSGNSIGHIGAETRGNFTLANNSADLYTDVVGFKSGIKTNDHNFTLINSNTLWLGNGGNNGSINAGTGTVDLSSNRMLQYGNAAVVADKLILRTTNYAGLSGTANSVNTLAITATGAGGGTLGRSFDFWNNKSLAIGSVTSGVGTVNGITTTNGNGTVAAQEAITVNQNINVGSNDIALFANNGSTLYGLTNNAAINAGGLAIKADNPVLGTVNNVVRLSGLINGNFRYTAPNELTIADIQGLAGLTVVGDVYLTTGQFTAGNGAPAYSATRPYTDYLNSTTNKYRAGLMIDEGINTNGRNLYINSASGVFQWSSDNSASPPAVRSNAKIQTNNLLLSGEGQFDLSLGQNLVNHIAANVNGSFSFASSAPFSVDHLTFSWGGITQADISGVQTRADTLISGSVAGGDAQYNQHNILLAGADDPNSGSNAAITLNQSVIADTKGSATINLSVGASDTHKDALVATTGSAVVQGTTLLLGAAQDKGAFNLKTNVTSLSAAGGKYMVVDNTAQTARLTVLGLGTSQGGGAPTPVGDVYLTTGGDMLLLGGKSAGNYLQLRSNKLDVFGSMDMKDGARVILQPLDMSRTLGVHNQFDFSGFVAQTNYSRSLFQQFGQTATFYVGSTPALMNQDSSVPSAVKNLTQTGDIHIGSDGDAGLKFGYRSLSAETSGNIVAYALGDVYNLRLAAPNVSTWGFNATGDQVHLIANNLSLPSAASAYTMPNNATVLLEPYTTNKSVWIGWIEPAYASETYYSWALLDKLDKSTSGTFIFGGTTDAAYTGSYLRLAHASLAPPNSTHYHGLKSHVILSSTGYIDTSLGAFSYLPSFSLQNWNAAPSTYPFVTRVETQAGFNYVNVWAQNAGRSNYNDGNAYSSPGTLYGFGKAGGTWGGCLNLTTCQGTNPSTGTGTGTTTVTPVSPGGGSSGNCSGANCTGTDSGFPPDPPAGPPTDPTNTTVNNTINTGNNNSNNGGNNGSGNTNTNTNTSDPNAGMNDGGPSNGGGSTGGNDGNNTSGLPGNNGGGTGSNGGNNGGDSSGTSTSGTGTDGGNTGGTSTSGSGDGSGTSGANNSGDGSNGSGNNGSGSGSSGSGSGGSGSGDSGSGDGSGGSGSGSGSSGGAGGGSGNGAGNGSDAGTSGADGSGADGSGTGSGGSGSGGAGSGNGDGSGGAGSGGGGTGGDGSSGGNGGGSGSGAGSGGSGDSGGSSGAGTGQGGGSSGGDSDGSGNSGNGSGNGAGGAGSNSGGSGGDSSGAGNDGAGSGGANGGGSGTGDAGGSSGAGNSGDGAGSGSGSRGSGASGAGDSGDGAASGGQGSGGQGEGAGTSGAGNSRGTGSGGGDDSASDGAGGKGGNSGGEGDSAGSGRGTGGGAGDSGTSGGSGKDGGSAGGDDSASGTNTGSGKGGSSGSDDSAGSGGAGSKRGGDGGGDDSDKTQAGSGRGDKADAKQSGSDAQGGDGAGGSKGGGNGAGITSDSNESLCIGNQNANRGQDLPEQGGSLANRPLLEVRGGGVNLDSDCSKKSSGAGAMVGAKGK